MAERNAHYWHPRHEYRGFKVIRTDEDDQTLMWRTIVLGWWSVDVIPPKWRERLEKVMEAMKRMGEQ